MSWHIKEIEKYDYSYRNLPCIPVNGWTKWEKWSKAFSELSKGEKILDAGCGPGYTIGAALSAGYDIVGIDIVPYLEEYVWPLYGIERFCQLAFIDEMPFDDNEFGIVLCLGVLEHIPEIGIEPSLKEIKRVLRPHGLLCLQIGLESFPIKIKGEEAHTTLKPKQWWIEQITNVGFSVMETPDLVENGNLGIVGSYQ